MSRFLNDEQRMFKETARDFARKDVAPIAQAIDTDDHVPQALIKTCAELGFFGLFTSEEYGGLGRNLTNACVVLEEIAKASPALAALLNVQIVLCPETIALVGSADQKARFLSPSANGEMLLAYSQTEPAGAANLAQHQTRLTADGESYLLNGLKLFTTKGSATRIIVVTRTSRDREHGHGCVVVDKDQPGVETAPCERKLGWHGTQTGSVSYTDVKVPAENVLGGLLTAKADHALANQASFVGHAVTSLGCAEGLLEKTVTQIQQRPLYGGPFSRLQPVKYWVGQAYASIEACRSFIYDAARLWDQGTPDPIIGSACKAYVCDAMFDVTNKLMQLWGGSGIMDETGVNRYFRDARTNMVAEGASEMHYDILSGAALAEMPYLRGS